MTKDARQGGNEKASPDITVTPEMIEAGIIELEQSTPITDRASESEMRDLVVRIFRAMQRGSLPPCGESAGLATIEFAPGTFEYDGALSVGGLVGHYTVNPEGGSLHDQLRVTTIKRD